MPKQPIKKQLSEESETSNNRVSDALAGWLVQHNPPSQGGRDQSLTNLAEIFEADGAWILAHDAASSRPKLISGCLRREKKCESLPLGEESDAWVDRLKDSLFVNNEKEISVSPAGDMHIHNSPISHLLQVPVRQGLLSVGWVILAFDQEPSLSPIHCNLLRLVATNIAGTLHNGAGRRPREILTLQANLTGLIAKIIDPATDMDDLQSLTLEHTVLPLGASIGGIWLLTPDGDELELSSSLLRLSRTKLPDRVRLGQGLLGSVVENRQPLLTVLPDQHPDFDPDQDGAWAGFGTLLMVPLCRRNSHFGVLCLCWDYSNAVSDAELVIIENMADLASAFMANISLIDQLSGYSVQQNALLEMSRQIALGLDLETTIARGLQWVTRLVGVEFGLLWLVDDAQGVIRLEASIGSGLEEALDLALPLADEVYSQWGAISEPVVVQKSNGRSPFWLDYEELMGIQARDLIALPLESHGQLMGMVLLINRVGGLTLESEPAMLATAADMIALAVGNARLHSQTLDLIDERERAHALALQATRLATVGRLTATLSHEINNPMQAIRGALTLAQEDLSETDALQEYLSMCVHESDRVVDLVDNMRHVYLPQSDDSGPVNLNETLQSVMIFAQKVSTRQGVEIRLDLDPELYPVDMASDQIHLVLLSLALNLSDAVAAEGGDQILIRTSSGENRVKVEFVTQGDLDSVADLFNQQSEQPLTQSAIGMAFSQDIIRSLNGDLVFTGRGQDVIVSLDLPVVNPDAALSETM